MKLDQLIKKELQSLPGEIAHKEMFPTRKLTSIMLSQGKEYRLSAVMILLYFKKNEPHFILTQRQNYKGKHSGQISFPGGKTEPFDQNTAATALRETEEEIGVKESDVSLIGQLTEVYVPVSKFLIHPYIGMLNKFPEIKADAREVKTVLHCSISDLLNEKNKIETTIKTEQGLNLLKVPAFNFNNNIVWGATAIILNEFKFILKRFY